MAYQDCLELEFLVGEDIRGPCQGEADSSQRHLQEELRCED